MALTEQDIEAIRAVVEQDAEAVQRADWEAVTRMFTVDAIRFPPHQPPVRGRDAMRAWLQTFPPIQEFRITADEIVGCDDLAFVRGTYVLTVAPEAGAAPQTDVVITWGSCGSRLMARGCGPQTWPVRN